MIGMSRSRRIGLDAPRRLVAVDHRQLDVHQDQVGLCCFGLRHALLAVVGLDHLVARAGRADRAGSARLSSVSSTTRMRLVMLPASRWLDADRQRRRGRSSPGRPPTPPRCVRRASRRSAWRWRGRGRCRPSCACSSCRPAGTPRRSAPGPLAAMPGPVSRTATLNWPSVGRPRSLDLAGVGELDGVADEVEQHLGEAPLVAGPSGRSVGDVGVSASLLVLRERLGARDAPSAPRRRHRVVVERERELAGLDLRQVEHVVDEPEQVLAVASGCAPARRAPGRQLAVDAVVRAARRSRGSR